MSTWLDTWLSDSSTLAEKRWLVISGMITWVSSSEPSSAPRSTPTPSPTVMGEADWKSERGEEEFETLGDTEGRGPLRAVGRVGWWKGLPSGWADGGRGSGTVYMSGVEPSESKNRLWSKMNHYWMQTVNSQTLCKSFIKIEEACLVTVPARISQKSGQQTLYVQTLNQFFITENVKPPIMIFQSKF